MQLAGFHALRWTRSYRGTPDGADGPSGLSTPHSDGSHYLASVVFRRGTTKFTTCTITVSSSWFRVVVRSLIRPCSGRDFDGRTSTISHSTRSSSPGRTGRGQRHSSRPAPTRPPAGLNSVSSRSRIDTAAVYQPL